MATHSSILAWRIPWTEEPDGLQSMGSQRVRHYRSTNTFMLRAVMGHYSRWAQVSLLPRRFPAASPRSPACCELN